MHQRADRVAALLLERGLKLGDEEGDDVLRDLERGRCEQDHGRFDAEAEHLVAAALRREHLLRIAEVRGAHGREQRQLLRRRLRHEGARDLRHHFVVDRRRRHRAPDDSAESSICTG